MRVALETSTPVGSVAVGPAGTACVEVNLGIEEAHSEAVLPALDFALASAGVARSEVDEVVVGTGPGSFTGVRIAASIAKGWWFATGVPLYGYPSLLALAAGAVADERPVCALLDARRGQTYAACYGFAGGELTEWLAPAALAVPELVEELKQRRLSPRCVGAGAEAYRTELEDHGLTVASGPPAWPRASALLWLRERWPLRGRIADPNEWEPLYVRDSGARARRHTPQ